MTNLSNGVRALVVGAGPVGLTMAFELTRRGVSCRIVDKLPQPSDKSKALVLHSRTLEMLETMGLAEVFLPAGNPAHGTNFFSNGKKLLHLTFDELDAPYPYGLMIPQCDTERILNEQLEKLGVKVERSVELVSFKEEGDKVVCTLRNGTGKEETLEVPWLLGCDGAHSTARHTLKLPFEGQQYEENFATADGMVTSELAQDELSIFVSEDGMLAFFPLGGGRFRVIADSHDKHATGDELKLEDIQAMVDKRSRMNIKLSDPIWLTWFAIHRRSVPEYRQGRVFLCGDAAHIHSPALGQGMNTGMQDAYNLAWKLALVESGICKPEILDSYHAERHPVGQQLIKNTDRVTKMATIRNPIAQSVRARLIPLLAGHEVIQQRMLKMGTMLAVNYRHSPIVGEYRSASSKHVPVGEQRDTLSRISSWLDFGHGPSPGDRAPDADLETADGNHCRLFEALKGTRHNLILFGGAKGSDAAFKNLKEIGEKVRSRYSNSINVHYITPGTTKPAGLAGSDSILLDPEDTLHHKYGANTECLYLIRPDGIVGYRSQPADWKHLEDFLTKIFV